MPVFRSGKGNAPEWCEMENFELIELEKPEVRELVRESAGEELIVCRGRARIKSGCVSSEIPESGTFGVKGNAVKKFTVSSAGGSALVFRATGRWKSVAGAGLFTVRPGTPPDFDTPYKYVKTTGFDNHYHDCDEYWVIFEGEARVASENRIYDVRPGDCLVTGMGWHHDVLSVKKGEMVKGVYLEGALEGRKRKGHLWEPEHGRAEPEQNRI